jgi:hypothetical protein
MKRSIFFDLIIVGVLMYTIAFMLSNTEVPDLTSDEPHYWSGDDTLKIMIVKDSAYIVKK